MRNLRLSLNDEQFMELYAMSASFLKNNKGGDCAIADLMQHIHDQCEPRATKFEREYITVLVDNVSEILNKDSADVYLLRAGMNGIAEQINLNP